MGCDIHMTLEVKTDKGWLGLHSFEDDYIKARGRNYDRFAMIAGVRGEGPSPRGVPEDASELAKWQIEKWEGDGHSHTWLTLKEAERIWLATERPKDDYAREYPLSHYFGVEESGAKRPPYRLVIFFDN